MEITSEYFSKIMYTFLNIIFKRMIMASMFMIFLVKDCSQIKDIEATFQDEP